MLNGIYGKSLLRTWDRKGTLRFPHEERDRKYSGMRKWPEGMDRAMNIHGPFRERSVEQNNRSRGSA